jgi:alpha-N-acetylglucosaminidase
MQLDSRGGKVVLRGTGGVELASALNWYMNDYLNATYDWSTYAKGLLPHVQGDLSGPGTGSGSGSALPLPLPASRRAKARTVPHSYYLNVCTYGYSLAFAPWEYWIKHIDWMAMNGITTPLAFVGQETRNGYGWSFSRATGSASRSSRAITLAQRSYPGSGWGT